MTVRGNLTTKGFEEYLERLATAGEDVNARAAEALNAGRDVALDGMRGRVPIDTGNLQEHLNATAPKIDGNFVYIEVGLMAPDANTARYGTAQEYGTARTAAHPYIRPTFDEDKRRIMAAIKASLQEQGTI